MFEFIVGFLVGVAVIIIGVLNMKGNLSMVHKYHTKRVAEEDKIPFGRQMGLGSIIIGISICVGSVVSIIEYYTKIVALTWIGNAFIIVGLVVGIIIIIKAMIKYNKGVF